MYTKFIPIILLILLWSCRPIEPLEIVWDSQYDSYPICSQEMVLKGENLEGIQEVYLYTSVQNSPMDFKTENDTIHIKSKDNTNCFSGPAFIIVSTDLQKVVLPFEIPSEDQVLIQNDFRTPKTLNTDSLVAQQSIVYEIGTHRSLLPQAKHYAQETYYQFTPKDTTLRAREGDPKTAFYIEAGSVKDIKITLINPKANTQKYIKSNLLQDSYGNTIRNGTEGKLFITSKSGTQILRSYSQEGIMKFPLPNTIALPVNAYLEIGAYRSKPLKIMSL